MPIRAHLKELRNRLLLALAGIGVGAIGGWFLYEPALKFITAPLAEVDQTITNINFQTIGAAFDLKMQVSLWIGLMISSPWWVYQLFAFISPGLKRRERWHVVAFGIVGVLLFLAGAYTGIQMVPLAVQILLEFTPSEAVTLLRADSYFSFYMKLVTAFGVSFLIPEVLVVLNFLGMLSAKQMLKGWRWAVIISFVFAAIANPVPTPWPMIFQALVLIGLYLLAVLISWIHEKIQARRDRKNGTGAQADEPDSTSDAVTNTAAAPTQPDPALPQAESALPQPESASAINSHNPDLQSAPDASHGEAPPAPIEATQTPIEAPWHQHQTNPNPGTSTQ